MRVVYFFILVFAAIVLVFTTPSQGSQRNDLWNQFTKYRSQDNAALLTVNDYLRKYQNEERLPELDASAILALDKAIDLLDKERSVLRSLRNEIVTP